MKVEGKHVFNFKSSMQTSVIVKIIYVFHPIIEQIFVHYKNLEKEVRQIKMKQKAPTMLPASKNLLYLFTNWVFSATHFSDQAMRKSAKSCNLKVLRVVSL